MSCKTYSDQIKNLVENNLDEHDAEQITRHLISCQNCENEFENLFDQKDIYVKFLFGIEPPPDLSARFQSKLEFKEQQARTSEISFGLWQRLPEAFVFLRLNSARTIMAAVVLLAISVGLFVFVGNENAGRQNESVQQKLETSQLAFSEQKQTVPKSKLPYAVFSDNPKKIEKEAKEEIPQLVLVNQKAVKQRRATLAKTSELNAEEENQFAQIQSLEIDSAKQIEKIEMLFRSFRNARSIEETGQYDVDYEKQQARKLLQNNAQLKQRAERYGNLLTEETLNKVEPYLLDIANLDSNSSAEQVPEIKARFRSQNIIASLQGF